MDFTEFKHRINSIPVAPELLAEAMVMIANLPAAEQKSFETRTARVVEFVEQKGWGEASCFVAIAITVRLIALDSVLDNRVAKEWQLPAADCGVGYVHHELLRVAAEEPVLEGPNGQPVFAIAPFCTRLMATVTSKGRA